MNVINKENLRKLIESHFHKDLKKEEYEVKSLAVTKLLTHARLDIAFKLLYLEMLEYDVLFSKHIYKEHIKVFSLGQFIEPGNIEKNSIDSFLECFKKTFEDIKKNGFDSSKTLIPLSKNSSIANGAHRVASAIFLGKDVKSVKIDTDNHIYDYRFFQERGVSSNVLDIVATRFISYSTNTHIAFIWPSAVGHDKDVESLIPNIVYRKSIQLSKNGAHNLLSQIYFGEEWLGSVEDNFKGAEGKLVECFKNDKPVRVIAFHADSLNDVVKIKDEIRAIFNIDKHSIHITDTKDEADRVARTVFNDNSVHFLNYAKPNKYASMHKKVAAFKAFISNSDACHDDVLLDGSMVLSAYGIREANDIDYFTNDNNKVDIQNDAFECHDSELKYHDIEKLSLIYNPQYYFYFNDVKFVSFEQVYKMKKNRNEAKDIADCKMMEALLENNKTKAMLNKFRQSFYYQKIKTRVSLIKFLRLVGLHSTLKFLYRLMVKK
jgi:hypothetical protein